MFVRILAVFISFLLLASCASTAAKIPPGGEGTQGYDAAKEDPYLWLEDVESPKALQWASEQNDKSLATIRDSGVFSMLEPEVRKILLAKDRIPMPALTGNFVYNFWQDEIHVRGIWRKTTLGEFSKSDPKWETILDIDQLAKDENENWVWKGVQCLESHPELCLVRLSRGGKDAVVIREFNAHDKEFVKDGFYAPEAKSTVEWLDKDTLLIGTNNGPETMTSSGYPREVQLWKRGELLSKAPVLYQSKVDDMSATPFVVIRPEGTVAFIERRVGFFDTELFMLKPDRKALVKLDVPTNFELMGVFNGSAFGFLRKDWNLGKRVLKQGTLLDIPLKDIGSGRLAQSVRAIYTPDAISSVLSVLPTKNYLYVALLNNIKGELYRYERVGTTWSRKPVGLPVGGSVNLLSSDEMAGDKIFVSYESYVQPTSLYLVNNVKVQLLKKVPDRFDATDIVVERFESTSKDGTKIPYSVIRSKHLKLDGSNPTVLYGYGGFQISMLPSYLAARGKVWVEKGFVWVVANIRGGGEFGPRWHEAALKENRQRAYDDFISVAEDLNRRKITGPRHLGMMGGSNGGLLMGAVVTQRPDLFNAVVCQVPLLDMLRFHKLLAGHSWTAEYGNPDDPVQAAYIAKYSPYQNVRRDLKYPRIFFMTSTKDDRVHPGHARKMVARMKEYGHDVFYYENMEGGHSAAANLEQAIFMNTLAYTYFYQQLVK